MEKHQMLAPGDKVVVGCSGGADSVCLLFLLLEYRKRVPVSLGLVHVNHCIRPDAGEDARYVESLCRERDIPFFLTEVRVRELARREKCSEEDVGRRVRYEAFCRAAEEMGGAKIAVAHNLNDNAETMLLHLFRGSGLKGLCGIAPSRDGIIRPILCLERREVEAYLEEGRISWRRDSTNEEDDYCRNRIRRHVLSYVEREVAQGAAGRMSRTAGLLSEAEDYLGQQTEAALRECVSCAGQQTGWPECGGSGGERQADRESKQQAAQGRYETGAGGSAAAWERYRIDVGSFLQYHKALRRRMILTLAERLSPTGRDISAVHVEDVLGLFEKPGNRDICLPFGICARRRYGEVTLERKETVAAGSRGMRGAAEIPEGRGAAGDGDWKAELPPLESGQPVVVRLSGGISLEFSKIFYEEEQEVPGNQCTKWLDYDKMIESPVVRFRRTGDYLTIAGPDGELVHKSLKDYMITEKIPRELRGKIPVVAMGSHVLWLVGYRISEYFKINQNTNYILQVELKKDCRGSKTEEENVGAY